MDSFGCCIYRLNDPNVTRAAANIAANRFLDFICSWIGLGLKLLAPMESGPPVPIES